LKFVDTPETVTVRFVVAAPLAIVKVVSIVVEFTTVGGLTVTPLPDTVTAGVPLKVVPLDAVRITVTAVPRVPAEG